MKIAVLTNDYPPELKGGAGIIAEMQTRELEKRGHAVRIFYNSLDFSKIGAFRRLFVHLKDLYARPKLVKAVLDWRPEVLLTHNLTGCGFSTPRAIQRQGIPWAHFLHDVQLIEPSGKIFDQERFPTFKRPWRSAWSGLRKAVFGSPQMVISPTLWMLAFHKRFGFFKHTKTTVIANPLGGDFFRAAQGQTSDGGVYKPPATQRTEILFIGRLDYDKGILTLLEAWQMLGDERPVLNLIGQGEYYKYLKGLGDERLVIFGRQSRAMIAEKLKQRPIVVMPSLVLENQPTVILEAMAFGCSIIASDVGGIAETLDGCCRLVPSGNSAALAHAILTELREPADEDQRSVLQRKILKFHNPAAAGASLESVLKSNL
ncbi:glycosyltransferase family 4 protein [Patescibacteria group bacterium]|nr:glycosyltransferase family 4 protein [Patescibacteria group bacterium]MBU1034396.1 glycosyltransferase family 4 protein [Patescibacteria group bacterium]MBU1629455.1 glycosyltransferase family 4 protein [Patescibacteria group bacterium]MBU1908013.1 glycosyltransferase family 4 protein [Patescibacteria group bacterium]